MRSAQSCGTHPESARQPATSDNVRIPPKFSVVVPCYNEEAALPEAVLELTAVLPAESGFELIVVDDGSSDRTLELLESLQKTEPQLTVVSHDRNRGYGAAIKTGIRHASSGLIVITDADGTYPNDRISDLMARTDQYDMVVGSRTGQDVTYSRLRQIPKVFLRAYASWIAGQHIPDINSGLRIFRRDLAERFLHMLPDGFSFTTTITLALLTNRYRVHYEPISYSARKGKSKIQPIRDTLRFFQLIARMGMYFAPLRVLGPFAFAMFLGFIVSLLYDVFILHDLTEKTLMLMLFGMNTMFFALLADMIEKRNAT